MKFYELHDPPDPERVARDFTDMGHEKFAALNFIVMHFTTGFPSRLEVILTAYDLNKAMPNHHPLIDMFDQADIQVAWDYLLKHKYLQTVTGH